MEPETGAAWAAAGSERLEAVSEVVGGTEEGDPPRGGSSMTYRRDTRQQKTRRGKAPVTKHFTLTHIPEPKCQYVTHTCMRLCVEFPVHGKLSQARSWSGRCPRRGGALKRIACVCACALRCAYVGLVPHITPLCCCLAHNVQDGAINCMIENGYDRRSPPRGASRASSTSREIKT